MAIMLVASLFAMVNVSAADAVVYVDGKAASNGTGTKEAPFDNIVDAFAAVAETGGTVTIIGDVDGFKKLTTKKTTEDEDGNVVETDEYIATQVDLAIAKKRVTVTSDGGALVFTNSGSAYFNHYGDVTYDNAMVNFTGGRVMFSAYNGHFICEANCTLSGTSGDYMYCTGTVEWKNAAAFDHVFANWSSSAKYASFQDTIFILSGDGKMGTLWNGGHSLNSNAAYITKDNSSYTKFWAGGQTAEGVASDADVYIISKNSFVGDVSTVGSKGGTVNGLYSVGAEVSGFTKVDAPLTATEVNENAALFNKVEKEYKVTADAKSLVNVASVSADAKLYAIVDGAAVEMVYNKTTNDGVWFSTVEGATNYVFADSAKEVEKPSEGGSASDTSDPIALIAIFAVVSLAGALVFKKVR